MIDPTAILALISDLYGQVAALTEENKALREAMGQPPAPTE